MQFSNAEKGTYNNFNIKKNVALQQTILNAHEKLKTRYLFCILDIRII